MATNSSPKKKSSVAAKTKSVVANPGKAPKKARKQGLFKKKTTTGKKRAGYASFRRSQRIKRDNTGIPSSWRLLAKTYLFFIRNWKKMGGVIAVYGVLYFLFVRAGNALGIDDYRVYIDELLGEETSERIKKLSLAGVVLTSAGQAASETQAMQGALLLAIGSLALIWTLRHIFAEKAFKIRDAYYRSQTPLIPFIIMFMIASIQLLPFAVGGLLFSIVKAQGITVSGAEDALFLTLWALLTVLSLYWITNTVMAMYAVTIPGMYPLEALRATKEIVAHRRWFVMRKVLFLPLAMMALFALGFFFVIDVWSGAVFWYIDFSAIAALPIAHVYMYHLYRSLV